VSLLACRSSKVDDKQHVHVHKNPARCCAAHHTGSQDGKLGVMLIARREFLHPTSLAFCTSRRRRREQSRVGEVRTTNSVLMAHQKGVTVPRFVDSSFSVASFTVLEAPLQRRRLTVRADKRRSLCPELC